MENVMLQDFSLYESWYTGTNSRRFYKKTTKLILNWCKI